MIRYATQLEPGLIDTLKNEHRFATDDQLAAAIRCTAADVDALRHGGEPSPMTMLAIAAITGRKSLSFVQPVTKTAA